MNAGFRSSLAALGAALLAHTALAQEQQPELTPAGKAVLANILATKDVELPKSLLSGIPAAEAELLKAQVRAKPTVFPLAMCAFPGGLCGAVLRDGIVAVPPRYDWVGGSVTAAPPSGSAASMASSPRTAARSSSRNTALSATTSTASRRSTWTASPG